jgi:hypothetical protein
MLTLPEPVVLTETSWRGVNVAVTCLSASINRLWGFVGPETCPDQPVKAKPAAGVARRSTRLPSR